MAERSRPSIREVAAHANVAMSSVSRVLSNHPDVSEAMRRRVTKAVEELGYRPDYLAQSLRSGNTLVAGFVTTDIHNPLLAEIAKGAEGVLRQAGYSMLISDSEGDTATEAENIALLERRRVDGLLLSLASEEAAESLQWIRETTLPYVLIDRELAGVDASAVLSDHRSGMCAAVRHLLDIGHRRIVLISAGLDLRPSRERVAGLVDALKERGVPYDVDQMVVAGPYSIEQGELAAETLLSSDEPPTAIIAGGNQLLIGLLRVIRRRNVRIPADLSVVTCDDTDLTRLFQPPIAAISRDNVEIGRRAADLLLAQLRAEHDGADAVAPETVMLPTWFTEAGSCGVPATAQVDVPYIM